MTSPEPEAGCRPPKAPRSQSAPRRRWSPEGIAHICATFNNVLITITDLRGNALALPRRSVMVMSTLLKVPLMCAIPSDSTTFLERLPAALSGPPAPELRSSGLVIFYFLVTFFLPAMARRGPFLVRAFVCVRCPRTGSPRGDGYRGKSDIHQALDVHGDFGAQRAFHLD